jgi:hypothetical protein
VQCAMNEGKKVGNHERELMRLGVHNCIQLYMCGRGHSVTISFPLSTTTHEAGCSPCRSLNRVCVYVSCNRVRDLLYL